MVVQCLQTKLDSPEYFLTFAKLTKVAEEGRPGPAADLADPCLRGVPSMYVSTLQREHSAA